MDHVAVLRAAVAARSQVEIDEARAVAAARALGVTWRQIANALGIPEAYAISRFGPQLRQQHGHLDPTSGDKTAVLAALRRIPQRRIHADQRLTQAIVAAKRHMSWAGIAEIVGVKRTNLAARYGPLVRGEASTLPAPRRPRRRR